jgi:hypothetical protein
MNSPQRAGALQQLMGAFTKAYSVLSHEEKRASYDRKLDHSYLRTEEEQTTYNCFRLATKCRRDGNETGRHFLVSQMRESCTGDCLVSCIPGDQPGDAEPFPPRSCGTLSKSDRARSVGPTGLFAARGALRNDATTVARRAVVFQSVADGSGPRRSATEPRSDR